MLGRRGAAHAGAVDSVGTVGGAHGGLSHARWRGRPPEAAALSLIAWCGGHEGPRSRVGDDPGPRSQAPRRARGLHPRASGGLHVRDRTSRARELSTPVLSPAIDTASDFGGDPLRVDDPRCGSAVRWDGTWLPRGRRTDDRAPSPTSDGRSTSGGLHTSPRPPLHRPRCRRARLAHTLKRNESRVSRLPVVIVDHDRRTASDLRKRWLHAVGGRWSETGSAGLLADYCGPQDGQASPSPDLDLRPSRIVRTSRGCSARRLLGARRS